MRYLATASSLLPSVTYGHGLEFEHRHPHGVEVLIAAVALIGAGALVWRAMRGRR